MQCCTSVFTLPTVLGFDNLLWAFARGYWLTCNLITGDHRSAHTNFQPVAGRLACLYLQHLLLNTFGQNSVHSGAQTFWWSTCVPVSVNITRTRLHSNSMSISQRLKYSGQPSSLAELNPSTMLFLKCPTRLVWTCLTCIYLQCLGPPCSPLLRRLKSLPIPSGWPL